MPELPGLYIGIIKTHVDGGSKRPSNKAAASEEARRTLRYVELLSDARTKLAGFFSVQLGDDAKFSADSGERDASSYQLFVLVGCRHLDANSCLTFRHNRVTEPHDVDSFF